MCVHVCVGVSVVDWIFLLILVPWNDTSKTYWELELVFKQPLFILKHILKAHRSIFLLTFASVKLELFQLETSSFNSS